MSDQPFVLRIENRHRLNVSLYKAGFIMAERKTKGKSPLRTNVLWMHLLLQYFFAVV